MKWVIIKNYFELIQSVKSTLKIPRLIFTQNVINCSRVFLLSRFFTLHWQYWAKSKGIFISFTISQFPECILLNAFESLKFDLLTIIFVVFQQNAFSVPRRFYLRDFQTIHLYNFSSLYDIINWLEAMNIFRALLINES